MEKSKMYRLTSVLLLVTIALPGSLSQSAPSVIIPTTSYSSNTGDSVTLSCFASGNPAVASITWYKIVNGADTTVTIDSSKYVGGSTTTPSLTINSLTTSDAGTYRCRATNSIGSSDGSQITLTVTVTTTAPTVTIGQNSYSIASGNTINLVCTVSANPAITAIFWQRTVNGATTTINIDGTKYQNANTGNPTLTITSTASSDSGSYVCSATNSLGTTASSATTLTVTTNTQIPDVTIAQTAFGAQVSTTITLGCTVNSATTVTSVFWQRDINNGAGVQTINIDGTNFSGSSPATPSLTIINADTTDTGTYQCFAVNAAGTGSSLTATVTIVSAVPTVTVAQSTYTVNTGTSVQLVCTVSSTTTVNSVFWQRTINGVTTTPTIDNQQYSGSSTGVPSLTVINADTADSGSYTCFASNTAGTGNSAPTTLTVVGTAPTVTVGSSAYTTTTGTTFTLQCIVNSATAITNVFWQRTVANGVPTTVTVDGVNFSGGNTGVPSLTVITADTSDTGSYTCFGANAAGTSSATTQLTVSGAAPTVTVGSSAYTTTTGTTFTLQCTVNSATTITNVFWQRTVTNGAPTTVTIDGVNFSIGSNNAPSLTVITASSSDTGSYTCFASNAAGTSSATTQLTVTGSTPVVNVGQTSYSTATGTTITLTCTVSANPAHTSVFWQRNVGSGTQSITIDGSNYSGAQLNAPSLTVINTEIGDSGTYTCFAVNSLGTGQSTTTLTVTGTSPTATVSQATATGTTGSTIVLNCVVSGNPAVTNVYWQKTVNSVTETVVTAGSNKYSGSTTTFPSLIISNAASTDSGVYVCFAVNTVGTGQSSTTTLTVTGNVPTVQIQQAFYTATTGDSVTLVCTVSGSPAHTSVFWQRNVGGGTQSITIDGVNYSGSTTNSPSLTVIAVATSDSGTYTCFATNTVGTGQSSATTLTVSGNVPTVQIQQAFYTATTGDSVTLVCTVSGSPAHTSVFWQRNVGGGTQSITIDGVNYSGSTTNSPSLTVIAVATSDSGTYTCFATNTVGTGQSSATTLTVSGSIPSVTVAQTARSVTTGTTVTLQCSVSANPTHTNVFWQFTPTNGVTTTLSIDNVNYGGSMVNSPSLTVFNTNSGDQGTYVCFASNQVGTGQSATVSLSVTGSLPVVTIAQNAYSVTTGQTVTLGCSVSATPGHTNVFWQRIDNGVSSNINIDGNKYSGSTVNNPSLTITSTNSNDNTVYTCSATNAVGTGTSGQTTLTVTGNVPVVTIGQTQYSVLTGQTVTLGCTVTANPGHTSLFWRRTINGVSNQVSIDGNKYQGATVNSPNLIITNAASSDAAIYSCWATNIVGTGQSSITTLTVTGSLPLVTIGQNTYTVTTGQTVTLGCTVFASPTHTNVFWQRIDNGVATTLTIDGNKYSGSTVNNPSLTITSASSNDLTVYTCSATNSVGTGTSGQTTLTVTGSLPVVTIGQNAYTVTTGQTVTLGCTVSASPTHTNVFWQRIDNGVASTLNIDGNKYSGSTVNNPSLTITSATSNDLTVYTCSATNSVGTGTSGQTTLQVTGSLPVVTIGQNAYTVTTGQTVTLGCTVFASPTHTNVFWQRIDNGVATTLAIDGNKYSGSTVNSPSLTITGANSNDLTVYTCSATNAVGTGTSGQTTLTVTGSLPVVTIGQNAYTVTTGQTVTLGCTVSASPTHTNVFWQRIDNGVASTLNIDGNKYSGSTVNNPSLTITSATSNDLTVYTCSATNAVGTGTSGQTTLTVTGSLPIVTIAQNAYTVTTGQSITLGCTVSASPTHTNVFWQRIVNGVASTLTIDGNKYSGSTVNSPSLTITSTNSNDLTVYTCSATNAVGTGTSGQTTLTVTGSIPVVTVDQPQYSVITGQTVTLGCTVSANPAHTSVFWRRTLNGVTTSLTIDGNKYQGVLVNSPDLIITNAVASDQATYTCSATNIVGTGTSTTTTLTVTGNLPIVTIAQNAYTVTTGQSITLGCTVSSSPTHTNVFWQRIDNGVASTLSITGQKYSGSTVNNPSLTIFNTAANDITTYTCSATNTVGTGTSGQTTLTVTGSLPVVSIDQPTYSVVTGQTVTLGCTVSASPTHTNVFWQRIDNGVATTLTIDGNKYSGSTVNSPSLTITSASSNDLTVYTCSATNSVGTGTSGQTTLTVTGNVPVVTVDQPQYSVITGQTVTLGCTVSANPAHTSVFWRRTLNGVTTTLTIDGNKYQGVLVNNPDLVITNAVANDQATYTCSATNIVGTGTSTTTTLTVTGSLPIVTIAQNAYSVTTGQSITLGCTVSASPTHTNVFWQRIDNGVATTLSITGQKYSGSTVNNPSLTIFNTAANDITTYTCSATNAVGTGTSGQTTLTVTGSLPVVSIDQPTYSVVTGQTVTLGCTVSATPTHTNVFWQRIDNGVASTLTIDGNKYSGSTVNSPSLTITSASSNDLTVYTCSATNSVGTGTSGQTTLTVTGNVPVVTVDQPQYSVITGQTVTLGCTVSANPAHTSVFWRRTLNGVTTSLTIDGNKYQGVLVNNPDLVITNAVASDQATYTCSATNIVGTGTSTTTTLTVTGSLPIVTIAQNAYSVITGQSITLGCTVSASPTHTNVFWQRIDNGVASTLSITGQKYSGSTVNNPSLTIFNTAANDITTYTCSATNAVGTGTSGQTTLTVTGSLPVVSIDQPTYSVVTGQTVTLGCTVSASPTHTNVFWQRIDNGVASTLTIDGNKYSGSSVNNPSLTITSASSNDLTVYSCSATNSVGTGTSGQTTLTVTGNVPVVTVDQPQYSVITGQTVTLGCTVSANPAHTSVFWRRTLNGVTTTLTIDGNKYQGVLVNNPDLVITNAVANDQATYTCSATNIVGTGTSTTTTLTVTGSLPIVTIAQNAYSVTTGQSITLGCTVSASPTHTNVFWQRIDNGVASTLSITGQKYSGSTVNNPSLTIFNTAANDITTYTCSATNAVGTGTSGQTTLTVTGSIPTVTVDQPQYSVITGQTVTLGCTVSATPAHTSVFWRRTLNGVTTTLTIDGNKYQGVLVNNPDLVITNAVANDQATYTCSATNIVGTGTSTTTTLAVTGSLPVVTIAQNAYTVTTGQSITLGCTVFASPTHTNVYWQRIDNGVATTLNIDGNKYSGSTVNSPSLTITGASSNDLTVYTCSATNAVGTGTSGQTTLTVTGSVPTVTVDQPQYSVITGQTVTLGCTVSATPAHTSVFWRRTLNGVTNSVNIDGNKYQGALVNNPDLIITNAVASDQATYTCSATNIVGTGTSTTTTLTVTGSLPIVTIAQTAYTVTTGQTVTLGCSVSATPGHTNVFWQRIDNGVATTLNIDGNKYSGSTVNNPSLTISSSNSNDLTLYTCSATNAVGTGTSGQTTLTVTGNIPVVTIAQSQYSVITGQTATLGCSVTSNPTHTSVFWRRTLNGVTTTLTIDGSKYQGALVNSPNLVITNVAANDQATYTCSASNIVGTGTSTTTTLTVTGSLPIVTIAQNTYTVTTGQTVTLGCTVSATPGHTNVYWQRIDNGVATTLNIDGSKYSGSTVNNPSLTITSATSNDLTVYTCSATNAVGTGTSGQTTLTVTGSLPEVTVAQSSYSVLTGQSVTLGCAVVADPTHTQVVWELVVNGVTNTLTIDGVKYDGATVNSPSLTILNSAAGDAGQYICSATNLVGTASDQTSLSITGSLPVVAIVESSYTVITGQTVTLECTVSANPAHTTVFWRRLDANLETTLSIDGVKYSGATVNDPSLTISNANSNDISLYKCYATNLVGTGSSSQTTLTVSGNVPVVTVDQPQYSVITGQTVTLGCTVSANPAHTSVFWQRTLNGVTTTLTIDGNKYQGVLVNNPDLVITNAVANDQATYTCSATNIVGTGTSTTTTLTVTGSLPVVTIAQNTYSVTTGQTVTLGCTVSATPGHTNVFWQRIDNGVATTLSITGQKYSGSTVNSPSLIIFNTAANDITTYTCSATNAVGTGTSGQTTLTVTGSIPVVTVPQPSYTVTTGQTAVLVCNVNADPVHTQVSWQRTQNGVNTNIVVNGGKYQGSVPNTPSLTITNAAESDEATYTCSATNAVGTGTSTQTTLTVTGSIPVVTIAQPSYSVITGNTATLQCTVSADPTHTSVFWQKITNGVTSNIVIDGNNYAGSTVNSPDLMVFNANSADQGTYVCFATNIVGTGQSSQTTLTVSGNLPVVTIAQNAYSVVTGQSITLGCTVSATPAHTTVYWQRIDNGVATQITIDGNKYSGSTVNGPSLTISNAAANDQTVYTCSATNAVGTGTSGQTTLSVTGNVPIVNILQNTYSVVTGTTATLECTVTADPAHNNVYWQRVQNGVTQSIQIDGVNYGGSTTSSPSLVVFNTNTADQGVYICFATNIVGTGQSSQTVLSVSGSLPVVTIAQNAYSVVTGQSITLGCTVSATPAHTTVYWQRIDNGVASQLTIDGSKYSGSTVNGPSLTISNAAANDQTVYTCSATNAVGTGTSGQTTLSVTGSPPVPTIAQNAYSVITGQSITLVCAVASDPAHSLVFWQRIINGQAQSITIDGSKYSGSTVNSPSLVISNAGNSDQGSYICFAQNTVGTGQSSQTVLTVTGSIPVVSIAQPTYTAITGQSTTLVCTVSADPGHTQVFWQRIDNGIATNINVDGNKYSGSTVNSPSLTISNVVANDQTLYTCSATNAVGTGTSGQTTLTVSGSPPVVTISQNTYSVVNGQSVTLGCTVSATPQHTTVYWQRVVNGQSQSITINNVKYSGSNVGFPSLTVNSAAEADEGVYICFATNIVGTGQSSQTVLSVTGSIPVVTIAQSSYSVITGQSITLGCTVSADPTHTQVFWRRIVNGVSTNINVDGNKYTGSTVNGPSLTIFNAAASDITTYTCSATNAVGTGTSSPTTLTVTGSPPTVTIAQQSYTITIGTTITLGCSVFSDPTHTSVFWQRVINGQSQAVTIDGTNFGGSTVNSPSLIVYNANQADEGTYICFATNSVGNGQSTPTALVVTGSIPVVNVQQTQYSIVTGNDLTIQCTVTADPPHTNVFWERTIGGVTSQLTIDGVNYSGSQVNSPSLTVLSTTTADSGTYVCKASNTVGTGQSSNVQLSVTGNVPTVTVSQPSYSVLTGSSVTLVCTVNASPSHTSVQWMKVVNGVNQAVNIGTSGKYAGSSVSVPSLTINGAQSSDQGQYICTATNVVGSGQSTVTTLSVTGSLPVVTVAQASYSVITGGTVTLVCSINASPAANTVAWRRLVGGSSTPVTIDNSKYSGAVIGNPSLTITNAQNSDEGFYICQATNVVGTGESTNTYVDVTGTIPVVTISQNSYTVLVGSSVTIDCTVSAVPSHTTVAWNRITNSGGNTVTTPITIDNVNYSGGSVSSPSLNVITADANDQGFYVCTAANSVGMGTSNQAFLSVTGAPPTVTVVQTSYSIITGGTITLQCSAFGNPAVTSIGWTRSINNGPYTSITIDGTSFSGASVNNPSLTVINADSNDLGIYKCSASNSLGTTESEQVTLTVSGNPPTVTVGQTSYNVITGSDVTVQCSVTAIPAASIVYWEKTVNGVTNRLTIDQIAYGGSITGSPSLVVYNVQSDDSGVYVCKASNAVGTGQSQQVTISVTGAAPVVTITEASYSVTTGTTAILECTVVATPSASTVIWRKTANGVTTTVAINNAKFSGGSVNSPSLVISNAASSDVAFYVCQATNAVGTGTSSQTYLEVTGALPIVQVVQPFYTVTKSQSVTLECVVTGTPAATSVAWERTSGGVVTSVAIDNNQYQGSSVSSPSLVISVSDSVDTGTYVCTATNSVGTGRSTPTTLTVTGDIPTVAITNPSYTVVTGFSIVIPCTVSANPPATAVSWTRQANINGAQTALTIDGTMYSGGSTSVPSLTINSASAVDQGYYICSATNSIGTGTSGQSYLTITGDSPTVTIPSNAYSVITGASIQIPCTVQASPPAGSVTWSKIVTPTGGNTVTTDVTIDGSKYMGSSTSTPSLTINNANNNDQAYYVCKATNSVGSGNSIQTYLTVAGSIPQVTLAPQFSTVLGTSITLDCIVSATPQADSVSWERIIGGVTTTLTIDGTKFIGSAVNNPSLTINSASADDQGYYVCVAINSVGIGKSSQGYLTVTGNVPAVVISQQSYSVILGNTVVIDCDYSSTPDATSIYWDKIVNTQTTRIAITQTNKYSGATLTNPSLTITGTDASDQAFYRCVVGNPVGEGRSSQAYLYVTGNLPTVTVPQSSYSVSLEDTVTISCTVTATPSATSVSWEYTNNNGVTIMVDLTNSRVSGGTVASPSLVIASAQLGDRGSYKCKATNSIGEGESADVYLYVTGTRPSVRVTVSAYTVDVGSQATLACIVDASPPATSVYWTKIVNGVTSTIVTSVTKYDGSTVGTPSLIINNLAVSDEGSYRCNAINTVGLGQSGLTSLIVAYAPRNTVVNPAAVTRRETESVTSECSTDANPAASYQWIKDSTSQIVSNEKTLQITNIDRGHDGTYTCTATNSQGSDTARLTVDVQYRPISTVTVEEATVTLSLNAQKNLECNTVANPAVQTYRWLKDGDTIANANSLVHQVTIADSNSYGVYTCYATNAIGQSSSIAFTVKSGDVVVTTPRPTDDGLTTGVIIAIVIAAVAFLLIVIIAVCCCVTHGVCRNDDPYETKRIIVEKPMMREPSLVMPRQEVIALQEDSFYRNPASQYRYLPALDYTYYESEGSKRERDRRSYTASIH